MSFSYIGIKDIIVALAIGVIVALVVVFNYRYKSLARKLFELLKEKYPNKLKEISFKGNLTDDFSFPILNYSSMLSGEGNGTSNGIIRQFKTLKKIREFNSSDSDLQHLVYNLKSNLITSLSLIIGSFGIVLFLLIYIIFL